MVIKYPSIVRKMPMRSLYSSNSSYYNEKEPPSNSSNSSNRPSSSTGIRRPATNNKNPAGGKVSVLGIFDNSSGNKSRDQRRTPVVLPHILLARPKENHVPEGYMASKYKRPMSAYSWKEKSVKAIEKMITVGMQNKQLVVDDENFEGEENEVDLYWNSVRINSNLLSGINFDQVKNYTIASTFYPEPSPTHRVYSVYKKQLREVSVPQIVPLSSTDINYEEGDPQISRSSSVGYLDNSNSAHSNRKSSNNINNNSSQANAVVSQFDGLLADVEGLDDTYQDNDRSNSNNNDNNNGKTINNINTNTNTNSSRIKIKEKRLKFDIIPSDISKEGPIVDIPVLSPRRLQAAFSKIPNDRGDGGGGCTGPVANNSRRNSSNDTTYNHDNATAIMPAANNETVVDGNADKGNIEESKEIKVEDGDGDGDGEGEVCAKAPFLPPIDLSDNNYNIDTTTTTTTINYSDTTTSVANDAALGSDVANG